MDESFDTLSYRYQFKVITTDEVVLQMNREIDRVYEILGVSPKNSI